MVVLLKFLFQQKANLRQKGENGIDVLCVPVMGRDKDGKEVILGVLEAVYPTPIDVIGEETTDSVLIFLLVVFLWMIEMERNLIDWYLIH